MVISSYSPLRENGTQAISSFTESLGPRISNRIVVEYMDTESFAYPEQWENWMVQLFKAYSKKPAAVVLQGMEAWSTYRHLCPEDWKDVPVVLGGVKKGYIDYFTYPSDTVSSLSDVREIEESFGDFKVTGKYFQDYLEQDLALIRRLQPQVRHIVFLYDDPHGLDFFRQYLSGLVSDAGFEDLIYLSGKHWSTQDVLDTISTMDGTYALLSAGWYSDVSNYPHAYSMLNNELSWDSSKFMYMVLDLGFTNINELGGYYVSSREKGKEMADLTYRVLTEGIENAPAFGPTVSNPRYHINYVALKNAGLDLSRVPAGAEFYNRPFSIFRNYFWETVLVVLLFLAVVSILCLIIVHRRKRERFYHQSNDRMKRLIETMPNMAVIFGPDLRILEVVNPRANMVPSALVGLHVDQLHTAGDYRKEAGETIASNVKQTLRTREIRFFCYQVLRDGKTSYLDARSVPYRSGVICFISDMTERIAAQNEASKLRDFLQSIVNNLPVGLHVKDATNQYRYVLHNQMAGEFYDIDFSGDILGKNDAELGVGSASKYHQEDLQVFNSDVPLTFERFLHDADGKLIKSGLATKSRWANHDGSCYIITVLVDLTDAKRKENELYSIQKQLSMAFDAGSLAAWTYDSQRRWFSSLHNETISGVGFSLDDALQRVHPDDKTRFARMMSRLTGGEEEKTKEILRFKQKNGAFDWFEIYSIAIKDPSGVVRQVVGTEKNITRTIQDEQKLKEYVLKFEMVSRSVGFVQWDYDVPQRKFFSPDPKSFLYRGESLERFLERVYPEDVPLIADGLEKLIDGQENVLTVEARVEMPEKGVCWIEMQAVVFARDERGKAVKITGLRRDITESKNLTEELIVLRDKAEDSNRLKSAFLANMSHEIRTPLNAIVGFSGLITETENKEEAREYYEIVRTNNELLLRLINDILDLSKIESGHLEFVYADVDICMIFRQLEQVYRYKVKPGVELECRLPDESFVIHSEKDRLTQVISNFLSNAAKFTSEGFIRMGYEHIPGGLRFYVADTGKGISEENLPRVFVRFAKFDSFVQGTGLGLSICEVIVKHLGGEIGVESSLGKGSVFWFTIPVGKAVKSSAAENTGQNIQDTEMENTPTIQASGKSILVAEDNDSNYLLLSALLKKEYRLTRAADGVEAVELFQKGGFDMILMDIKMPRMTGLEATREIRKTDTAIPIVALTAYAFGSDKQEAIQAGCNMVVTKPINRAELMAVLDKFLGNAESKR